MLTTLGGVLQELEALSLINGDKLILWSCSGIQGWRDISAPLDNGQLLLDQAYIRLVTGIICNQQLESMAGFNHITKRKQKKIRKLLCTILILNTGLSSV